MECVKISFGTRLRELRSKQDLTQEELAKQLGYHRFTLANWEIDRSDPNFEALKKMALF
ncbi:MAG: helix-turn-helix transcriptional regulator [Firmicutes bacterium]|nr:helix-turn-helix transcriptional regulator [Bacillota bacterium]